MSGHQLKMARLFLTRRHTLPRSSCAGTSSCFTWRPCWTTAFSFLSHATTWPCTSCGTMKNSGSGTVEGRLGSDAISGGREIYNRIYIHVLECQEQPHFDWQFWHILALSHSPFVWDWLASIVWKIYHKKRQDLAYKLERVELPWTRTTSFKTSTTRTCCKYFNENLVTIIWLQKLEQFGF